MESSSIIQGTLIGMRNGRKRELVGSVLRAVLELIAGLFDIAKQRLAGNYPLIPTQWASSYARARVFGSERGRLGASRGLRRHGPVASEPPVFGLSSPLYSPKALFLLLFSNIKDRKTHKTALLSCVANARSEHGVGRRHRCWASLPRRSLCEPGEVYSLSFCLGVSFFLVVQSIKPRRTEGRGYCPVFTDQEQSDLSLSAGRAISRLRTSAPETHRREPRGTSWRTDHDRRATRASRSAAYKAPGTASSSAWWYARAT